MDSSDTNRSPGRGVDATGTSMVLVNGAGEIAHQQAVVREVGALLIVSGIAGILLPGPVGTPLLILGCVMIWPKSFERIDLFFAKRFPGPSSWRRAKRTFSERPGAAVSRLQVTTQPGRSGDARARALDHSDRFYRQTR